MKLRFFIVAMLMAAAVRPMAQGSSARALLEAARKTEIVDGDLQSAIKKYENVVKVAGSDRALAATALVRMAECYQKLGDAQARKIFEQVIRDYSDQKASVDVARARLGDPASISPGLVTRQLWNVPREILGERTADGLGTVSPDGRYFSFVNWSSGDLFLHDFTTGENRRLTNASAKAQYAEESVISRDGARVAYAWFNADGYELRMLDLNAKDAAPRTLFANHKEDPLVFPYDWSPDGKWIAVQIRRIDGTGQLAMVSTADGALRVLESSDWRRAEGIAFSPDGKYLAYDLATDSRPEQHDVYIIAADGQQKTSAVVDPANDTVIGWTPDGGHLLFSSDRSGTAGIWAVPVAEGKPHGEPRLIKSDVRVHPRGIARSGALYFSTALSMRDIYVASVDFETGKLLSRPARIAGQTVGFNVAAQWSPDGESLAYLPRTKDADTIAIQSIASGKIRELRPNLAYVFDESPLWSLDGKSLYVVGPDNKDRWGIYRVDAQTAETTLLAMSEPPAKNFIHPLAWSADGQTLYIRRILGSESETIALDMRTRQEQPIRRVTAGFIPSPNGGAWAALERNSSGASLRIEPSAGGPTRTPLQVTAPEDLSGFSGQGPRWSPDSRFVVVRGHPRNVWAVPAAGGSPRTLDLGGLTPTNLQIHPDGHRVAIETAEQQVEVWVMENFPPPMSATTAQRPQR